MQIISYPIKDVSGDVTIEALGINMNCCHTCKVSQVVKCECGSHAIVAFFAFSPKIDSTNRIKRPAAT
jgi:hypothetical protein